MSGEPSIDSKSLYFFKSLSKGIGICIAGVGCLVLIGWALNIPELKSIFPTLSSMKSNTAFLFVLCGVSLWLQINGQLRRFAQLSAIIVALTGLLTIVEYQFNLNFGIDQILFKDNTVAIYPGRMSPATAVSFFLIGTALTFLDNHLRNRFREILILVVLTISMLALIGYLYGVSSLYRFGAYTSMALHTALSLILLSSGILFARPERGVVQTIMADTVGGNILRRFLPIAIIAPIILGWIRLLGQKAGLYDTAFGLALMVISIITMLTIFTWFNAKQLTEIDLKRQQIRDSLQANEISFRNTLQTMMEGFQVLASDWRYLYLNDAAEKHNRRPNHELLGKVYTDMWPQVESTALFATLKRCMNERISSNTTTEFIYPDGTKGWFELNIQPIPEGILILSSEITERKKAEMEILKLNIELEQKVIERTAELASANERLKQLSLFDQLTGLYNRRGFLLLAEEQLMLAKRTGNKLLVFYADLDGLKQINDTLGHIAGDESIVRATHALNETFRNSDIKARLGGDEFIVLAIEADEQNAEILLARLNKKLAENNQSMSIGVVTWDAHKDASIQDLMARADEAMYVEKRKKSNKSNIKHS